MTSSAFWTQGEIQAARALGRFPIDPERWQQTVLVPPDVLEVRLRLGLIPGDNHGRWQLEVVDPTCNELLALHSAPAWRLADLDLEMAAVGNRISLLLEAYLNPDPFP